MNKIINILLFMLIVFISIFELDAEEIKEIKDNELKKMTIKTEKDSESEKKTEDKTDKKLDISYDDNESFDDIKKLSFDFQPLGFLFYGPMINFGFKAGNSNAVVEFHFRAAAFGLTYNAVKSDWDKDKSGSNKVGLETIYFGPGFKYFFDIKNTPNKAYVGSAVEFGFGSVDGDVGTANETESEFYDFVFFVNGGYRWRFSNGFFLNLGACLGIAYTFEEKWWYLNTPEFKNDVSGDVSFVGQVELAVGFEF